MALLRAIKRGDLAEAKRVRELFMPLEDERDRHSPIRVLHEAVRLADICNTGPMQPYLTGISPSRRSWPASRRRRGSCSRRSAARRRAPRNIKFSVRRRRAARGGSACPSFRSASPGRADFGGRVHMRAAAGLQIDAGNRDQPHAAIALRRRHRLGLDQAGVLLRARRR